MGCQRPLTQLVNISREYKQIPFYFSGYTFKARELPSVDYLTNILSSTDFYQQSGAVNSHSCIVGGQFLCVKREPMVATPIPSNTILTQRFGEKAILSDRLTMESVPIPGEDRRP